MLNACCLQVDLQTILALDTAAGSWYDQVLYNHLDLYGHMEK